MESRVFSRVGQYRLMEEKSALNVTCSASKETGKYPISCTSIWTRSFRANRQRYKFSFFTSIPTTSQDQTSISKRAIETTQNFADLNNTLRNNLWALTSALSVFLKAFVLPPSFLPTHVPLLRNGTERNVRPRSTRGMALSSRTWKKDLRLFSRDRERERKNERERGGEEREKEGKHCCYYCPIKPPF